MIKLKNFSLNKAYIFIYLLISIFLLCRMSDIQLYDFQGQWKICAYTLRGYDPFDLVKTQSAPLAEIGVIPLGWGTSPWGCLLGNVFYPGFLTLQSAKLYFVIAHFVFQILAAWCLYFYTRENRKDFRIFVYLLSIVSIDLYMALHQGNAGGMICCILIMAWLLRNDFPVITGILLGVSMVKPQITLIICYAFLLQKRFKPLLTAAWMDMGAWAGVSLLTGKNMIFLLEEFLSSNIGGSRKYTGIFSILSISTQNTQLSMALSMLFGVIFVSVSMYLWPADLPEIFQICPAFLASTFWCYAWSNDNYILMLPSLLCVFHMICNDRTSAKIFWLLSGLYLSCGYFCRIVFSKIGKLFFPQWADAYWYGWLPATIYYFGVIIIGLIFILWTRRSQNISAPRESLLRRTSL